MNKSKYSFNDKKQLSKKIEILNKKGSKDQHIQIGKIILNAIDKNKITEKNNGIWFDLNIIDDKYIEEIDKVLKDIDDYNNKHNDKISFVPLYKRNNLLSTKGPKFSNHEKVLIKKFNNNNDNEYKILDLQLNNNNL